MPMKDGEGSSGVILEPDSSYCIETMARQEFERCVGRLLNGEADVGLAAKVGLLRLFLETADFSELRRISEPLLAAGRRVAFTVYDDGGVARYRLQNDVT
jgi:hypothetical protein